MAYELCDELVDHDKGDILANPNTTAHSEDVKSLLLSLMVSLSFDALGKYLSTTNFSPSSPKISIE
jgi:hypothetical protein